MTTTDLVFSGIIVLVIWSAGMHIWGWVMSERDWQKRLISLGLAHYDPKTAEFKLDAEERPK